MKNRIRSYLKYLLFSKHKYGHGIHSPFIFSFITNILNDKTKYDDYSKIEYIRQNLLTNNETINRNDFGAGNNKKILIQEFTKNAAVPSKYGKLLYRISKYYQPKTVLELGTAFGISTAYLSLPVKDSRIVSIEGCANTASIAQKLFNELKLNNITLVNGVFSEILPLALIDLRPIDLIFIDGDHKYESTLNYFLLSLNYINEDSIIIFDDIYWSDGMTRAWEEIKRHTKVSITIDLYRMGLVFFRGGIKKQDFTIRF